MQKNTLLFNSFSIFLEFYKLKTIRRKGSYAGADLGFSRGGGADFQKILTTFFFFRSTKLIFRALPKHCFAPILAKFSAPEANF